jgi:hypothetical protein
MTDTHTGRCLCGAVRYRTEGKPLWVAHCHCESCRRQTGCAVATFVGFREGQVRFTKGAPAIFESSPGVRRGFCAACGTPLTYGGERAPGEVHLYVATFDDPESFAPTVHVHVGEKLPWFDTADDLPRYRTTGRAGEPPLKRPNA